MLLAFSRSNTLMRQRRIPPTPTGACELDVRQTRHIASPKIKPNSSKATEKSLCCNTTLTQDISSSQLERLSLRRGPAIAAEGITKDCRYYFIIWDFYPILRTGNSVGRVHDF